MKIIFRSFIKKINKQCVVFRTNMHFSPMKNILAYKNT